MSGGEINARKSGTLWAAKPLGRKAHPATPPVMRSRASTLACHLHGLPECAIDVAGLRRCLSLLFAAFSGCLGFVEVNRAPLLSHEEDTICDAVGEVRNESSPYSSTPGSFRILAAHPSPVGPPPSPVG